MTAARQGIALLVTAALALVSVWRLVPGAPPLYDGLTRPADPYRYLNPPAHYAHRSLAPYSSTVTAKVGPGPSQGEYVATAERPPQIILSLDIGAFRIPHGVSALTLSVRPVPPPAPAADGPFDGNVYLVSVRAGQRELPVAKPASVLVELRRTSAQGSAVLEQYLQHRWQRIHYNYFVNSVYVAANPGALGYFALVRTGATGTSGTGGTSSGGRAVAQYVLIGIAVVLLAIAGAIALRLGRRAPAPAALPEPPPRVQRANRTKSKKRRR